MDGNVICPYPGLRPFNEDEAIFFKGREEHIEQIVKQLEEKKFLMLTGASGDGKSSLVYAGVIPNARAGFFKAKFNNWIVADFRPERAPLANMASTINEQLKLNDVSRVEKEFSYGFSSLIDLYKSSTFWIDQQSENFRLLSPEEQKKTKRKGANLLILVDQFEEFFTNPENYTNGKTSVESQAVVNLLLETTRLAIEQDLPIYIICTMRSDYIGQCASFRGLPEYIGYSQFFVPRLKRQEIYQVIEEPAQLNGDKISKRLVEMLINEMNDGIDQLPVLQHALNQIWQKADYGKVEMDLIHFAKINGIPRKQLPAADQAEFENWFNDQPEFKKEFFKEPSLGAVLDAHANELYENADVAAGSVSKSEAKLIVETTFKCLTKIDESRAVRNRMSLEEVTQIINQPQITTTIVAGVLQVFRIQGNTFLKPFIFDNDHSRELNDDSVLDITHESLIRNWKLLSKWAHEEYESYLTWQDFNKQLQRWIKSGKSSGYLLPIGPLTFFETWYNNANPNKYLLARYDDREISKEQKIEEAGETLKLTRLFIKNSARRLFFSRTVLKYGADKLITVFGILLLVLSCTYFYFDFRKKQNDYVVNDLQDQGVELLKSRYIKNRIKAEYILVAERLNPGTYKNLLKNIENDSSQIDVVREMFSNCLAYQEDKRTYEPNNPLLGEFYNEQLNLIQSKEIFKTNSSLVSNIYNVLGTVYGNIALKRNKFPVTENGSYQAFCDKTFEAFKNLLKDTNSLKKIDIELFNKLLQAIPEVVNYDQKKINDVIALFSPFNRTSWPTFDIIYPKDKTIKQNYINSLTHNGGYYELANLFALTNNFVLFNRSLDSLLLYNKNFLNTSYGYSYDRFLNDLIITGKLFTADGEQVIQKLKQKREIKSSYPIEVMMLSNLLADKVDVNAWTLKRFTMPNDHYGFNLQLQWERISYGQLDDLAENIIDNFLKDKNVSADEKNYMAALLYKAKAFANNKKENFNRDLINFNIDKSCEFYKKISPAYLKEEINLGEGTVLNAMQRSKIFKYGGLISLTNGWQPFHPYFLSSFKDKTIFVDRVIAKAGLDAFYLKTDEDAEVLNEFLLNHYLMSDFNKTDEMKINLKPFEVAIIKKDFNKKIDKDALLAFITSSYHVNKNKKMASFYAQLINKKEFLNKGKINKEENARKYYKLSWSLLNYFFEQPFSLPEDEDGVASGKQTKGFDSAFALLRCFPDPYQRRNAVLANIDSLQRGRKLSMALTLLDTMLNSYIVKTPKFGNKIFEILGRLSTSAGDNIAVNLMKNKTEKTKPDCLNFFVNGKSQSGNYYQATTFIPEYVSSSSQLSLYSTILLNEVKKHKTRLQDGWSAMDVKNVQSWWANEPGYEENENENLTNE